MSNEDALFEHLYILFRLYINNTEKLNELAHLLDVAEELARQQPFVTLVHRYRLAYYRACWYTRGEDIETYKIGETIFVELLAEIDPQSELQQLRADIFNVLGINYNFQERFDDAADAYRQAAEIYKLIPDVPGHASALSNQAIANRQLGRYEETFALLNEALELARQSGDSELQARILHGLGYSYHLTGEWKQAEDNYLLALSACPEEKNRSRAGRTYNNLGELYHMLYRLDEAKVYFEKALATMSGSNNRRDEADILLNLGFLIYTQFESHTGPDNLNRLNEAQSYYERALYLAQGVHNYTEISLIHYRLGEVWKRKGDFQNAKQAFEKAIKTVESLYKQVDEEKTRISVMGIRQYVYDAMILLCLEQNQPSEAFTYVEQARARAFLEILSQSRLQDKLPLKNPLSASEIQKAIQPDQALIEFFVTGTPVATTEKLLEKLPLGSASLKPYLTQAEKLLAFVVTNQEIHAFQLNISVQRIREQLFNKADGRLQGIGPNVQTLLPMKHWHGLHKALFDNLQPHIEDKRHLFIVPHNVLHYLPLHALANHGSITKHDPTVSYAPSASSLFDNILSKPLSHTDDGYRCLAVGFNENLRLLESQAQWVAKQMNRIALIGEDAKVSTVCNEIGNNDVVHFSCHGIFRNRRAMESSLVLFDGELTASQILQLRLKAKLVVLSACDTGLSDIDYNDELWGLTRSFLVAGARSLLVSLWPVYEVSTRIFMDHFYTMWLKGISVSQALIAAQSHVRTLKTNELRNLLREYKFSPREIDTELDKLLKLLSQSASSSDPCLLDHPNYWGAFLLIGDYR